MICYNFNTSFSLRAFYCEHLLYGKCSLEFPRLCGENRYHSLKSNPSFTLLKLREHKIFIESKGSKLVIDFIFVILKLYEIITVRIEINIDTLALVIHISLPLKISAHIISLLYLFVLS